jgi:acetyltransferase-like isoleucine patch superfamily enzyme
MNKWKRLLRYDWPLHCVLTLTNWFPDNVALLRIRGFLARPFLGSAGKNVQIGRDVTFYNARNIHIGKNVYIAKGTWFSASVNIRIEDNVLFGPYVVVVTSNHSIKDGAYYFGEPVDVKEVVIQSGAWIGAHSTILSGSVVNKGVLVAANSVFKGVSEPYGIYAGTPAKWIKNANEQI